MKYDYLVGYARRDITPTEQIPITGYMPTAYAWWYTYYESDTTRFAPGTAEDIAYRQLCLLRRLKER